MCENTLAVVPPNSGYHYSVTRMMNLTFDLEVYALTGSVFSVTNFALVHANWRLGSNAAARPAARFGSLVVTEHTARSNRQTRNALEEVKSRRQRILDWQAEYRRDSMGSLLTRHVVRMRLCASVTGTAVERWTDTKRRRERTDYTSYVGQDALRCLAKYPSQTLTAR